MMARTFAVLVACSLSLVLSACAATSDSALENSICSHQVVTTNAAEAALTAAQLIKDPAARTAAIMGANAALSLVAGCPGYAGPVIVPAS